MSELLVRPATHQDAIRCIQLRTASLGSLVIGKPPPYPGYVDQQITSLHTDLAHKPHILHLKVVETETGEPIAYAKWEMYPHGRPDLEQLTQPMDEASKNVDQYGRLREAAHEYFSTRNGGEMGRTPHLLLALLVTSSENRGRGAGSLLVRWGVQKSEEMGLPCYLQASEQGRRLYEHHGFNAIDTVEFNISNYGLEGVERMTEMTRRPKVHLL